MKRALVLALVVCSLSAASVADAAYYVGQSVAEHYARQHLHSYGYTYVATACRPQAGRNESYRKDGHVLWHKWLCGFAEGVRGDSCKGALSIVGSDSGAGYYYLRHWSVGEDC
jgi:hypothetical protein